jgi:hypothetical protein
MVSKIRESGRESIEDAEMLKLGRTKAIAALSRESSVKVAKTFQRIWQTKVRLEAKIN